MGAWEDIPEVMQNVLLGMESYQDYVAGTIDEERIKTEFAEGFGFTGDQYDTANLSPDDVMAIRDLFLDDLGWDFDWDAWREAIESLYED